MAESGQEPSGAWNYGERASAVHTPATDCCNPSCGRAPPPTQTLTLAWVVIWRPCEGNAPDSELTLGHSCLTPETWTAAAGSRLGSAVAIGLHLALGNSPHISTSQEFLLTSPMSTWKAAVEQHWLDPKVLQGPQFSILQGVLLPRERTVQCTKRHRTSHISISLECNGLNAQLRRYRLADWIRKHRSNYLLPTTTHLMGKDTYRLNTKGWKKIYHPNGKENE